MRAVQITRFGGPEVLDLPDPQPGPGQKVFSVSTAGNQLGRRHYLMSAI